ncbi:uncharacterized protein CCOS01_13041 [Colletotrichum costaricense]|uniref:Uncharacterized protein n=1 Tax=Colletotrichum costaricense TaxID=1209916 RepID=A0AAI9YMP7_9PEZI|nr:uncharacterized protein CCOS01_13041 [Colletotrichum costaricense]KAI3548732.1 hypothetical protein CSPX01_02755 [Colletotrichum filicis]KAK1515843.1 hypothetical protein CCOS01_13041 [Colletotrichum costaricense]KAK1714062.1 hypothetical protein BDP67DRAFT_514672 [Colletotrichum lupini]
MARPSQRPSQSSDKRFVRAPGQKLKRATPATLPYAVVPGPKGSAPSPLGHPCRFPRVLPHIGRHRRPQTPRG